MVALFIISFLTLCANAFVIYKLFEFEREFKRREDPKNAITDIVRTVKRKDRAKFDDITTQRVKLW